MATIESLEAKIDKLIETLRDRGSLGPAPAYENPPIAAEEAVVDGKTVNRDGSIWDFDWSTNKPQPMVYGYFSEAKDPATYAAIVEKFGDKFLEWHAGKNPWTIYAGDPKAYMDTGAANWVTLMNHVLVPRGIHVQ